jgi:hypothetical protein
LEAPENSMNLTIERGLIGFALLVSFILFAATAGQPFHLDNMDYPAAAKAVTETGLPVYYRGEENTRLLGLFHPPLYIYLLAGWSGMFGFGPVQIRIVGYLCLLIQFWLALRIMALLFSREGVRPWTPLVLLAFLPNAYALQTSSIVDIDTTIYGPILLAVLYFSLSLSWRDGVWHGEEITRRDYFVIAALLAVALWAKLTTSILTIFVVPLLLFPKLRWQKALLCSLAIGIGGILMFAGSYWLYGALTKLNIGYTYEFTLDSFLHRGATHGEGFAARMADYATHFVDMLPLLLRWTGALPLLAAALGCASALYHSLWKRDARLWHAAVVTGTALFVTLFYCAQTMTFGQAPFKYVFVYWCILAVSPIVIARTWDLGSPRLNGKSFWIFAVVYVAGFVVGFYYLNDELLLPGVRRPYLFRIWNIPAMGLVLCGIVQPFQRAVAGRVLAVSILLAGGMACGVARYQAGVDYSTTYDYGQRGMREAATVIRALTQPDDRIASMKDIGFLSGRRYVENYRALYEGGEYAERFMRDIRSGAVTLAVFTEERGQDILEVNPTLKREVESQACLVYSTGNYRIYRPYAAKTSVPLPCLR